MSIDTLSTVEQDQVALILLNRLKTQRAPMGFQELESRLASHEKISPRRLREAAWKLVEEGKIRFNSNWDLEAL